MCLLKGGGYSQFIK